MTPSLIANPVGHPVTAGIPGLVKKFIKQEKKPKSILKCTFEVKEREFAFDLK